MALHTQTITSIFLNFLFALGVILAVAGFITGLKFLTNTLLLSEYPLAAYEENCSLTQIKPISPPGVLPDSPTSPDLNQALHTCQDQLIRRRQIQQIQDATHSFGLLASGIVLFLLFHPKSHLASQLAN